MLNPIIAIHAGAGTINIREDNQARIQQQLEVLRQVVQQSYAALQNGTTALDVVEQAVMMLEDDEGFNAGRGSVLNAQGVAEMDAAIMDGNRRAGGLAAVQRAKNPISGARAVMEYSNHVLLAGTNADKFCEERGLEMAEPSYFITSWRKQQWQEMHILGHALNIDALGTVGAVARDKSGHLAAATSTGGKANKIPGRVGDSPILGAGTWADNRTCAISGTGDGDIFMRCVFAHEIHAQMIYQKADLKTACQSALNQVATFGGEGGCIAIDKHGNLVIQFNTTGMFRAWVDGAGEVQAEV